MNRNGKPPGAAASARVGAMPIYLDNNATTAIDPAVVRAMAEVWHGGAGNPSSTHAAGRAARQVIDRAGREVAARLGCRSEEVHFTSGATEANNLAVQSAGRGRPGHVLVCPCEHPSTLVPAKRLELDGWTVEHLPLTRTGRVQDVRKRLRDDTRLVILQHANGETGTVQDVAAVAAALPDGCLLHCDATQSVGKIPVDFAALGATTLSLSGHKFHGPPGVGALLVRRDATVRPLVHGGRQQGGIRAGTEPVALIAGLAAALTLAVDRRAELAGRLASLRDRLQEGVLRQVPDAVVNGDPDHRLPNTCNLSLVGAKAETCIMALDLAGVCCSAGTACASGSLEDSATLLAMNLPSERVRSAVRFSVGRFTTAAEIDRAVDLVAQVVVQVRQAVPA